MENTISFTKEVKEEISTIEFDEENSYSLLSAFIRICGTLSLTSEGTKLLLKTEDNKIAKFIYKLLKTGFPEISVSFSFKKLMRLNKNIQYIINVNEGVDDVLSKLKIDFLESKIPYSLTDKDSKIRSYFKGLFLASGAVSNPNSSNYHLEIYTTDEAFSNAILKLTNKIKHEFNFKLIKRRKEYVIYLKRSSQIADFLAYLEVDNSLLLFEDIRINRDYQNSSNRLINMDTYNLKKTMNTANEQIEMINDIDKKLGIKNISNDKVRELCYLRLENPEANFNDLAELLSEKFNKPISKSNINHLFIKLRNIQKGKF